MVVTWLQSVPNRQKCFATQREVQHNSYFVLRIELLCLYVSRKAIDGIPPQQFAKELSGEQKEWNLC